MGTVRGKSGPWIHFKLLATGGSAIKPSHKMIPPDCAGCQKTNTPNAIYLRLVCHPYRAVEAGEGRKVPLLNTDQGSGPVLYPAEPGAGLKSRAVVVQAIWDGHEDV